MSDGERTLKLLSVNACVLCSGLRNRYLVPLTVGTGFMVGVACTAGAVYTAARSRTTLFYIVPFSIVICSVCIVVGHVFAVQLARGVGGLFILFTRKHEFKRERLRVLAEVVAQYDVVGVQELYSAKPACIDAGYPEFFIQLCHDRGLKYAARPHTSATLPYLHTWQTNSMLAHVSGMPRGQMPRGGPPS